MAEQGDSLRPQYSALNPKQPFLSIPPNIVLFAEELALMWSIGLTGMWLRHDYRFFFAMATISFMLAFGILSSPKLLFTKIENYPENESLTKRLRAVFPAKKSKPFTVHVDLSPEGALIPFAIRKDNRILVSEWIAVNPLPPQIEFLLVRIAMENKATIPRSGLTMAGVAGFLCGFIPAEVAGPVCIASFIGIICFVGVLYWYQDRLSGPNERALKLTRDLDSALATVPALIAIDRKIPIQETVDSYEKRLRSYAAKIGLAAPRQEGG